MLIKPSQSVKKQNSPNCTVWEYNFKSKNLSFATAKINGRYPEKGQSLNQKCDSIYYIISGSAKISYQNKNHLVKKGDAFFIQKGRPYSIQAKNLFLAIISQPAWNVKQYKIV